MVKGILSRGTAAAGMGVDENGMGLAVGDIDGDGDLDVFISGIFGDSTIQTRDPSSPFGFRGNVLYENIENQRKFIERSKEMGIQDAGWGWGAAFLDIWNRGGPQQPEIIVANGLTIPETTYDDTFWNLNPTKLFSARHTNGSSSVWRDLSDQAGINSTEEGRGVVIFDWNKDGKEDVLVVNHITAPILYENVGGAREEVGDFLQIAVKEACGRDSVGARVELIFSDSAWQRINLFDT